MDLNNNLNDNSEWLKEQQKIADSNKKISSKSLKVPLSNEECCGYPAREVSNDGYKTQRCPNCGWTNKKWYEFYK